MIGKLNRCVEHGQELVAICVDQLCERRIKAVCPLELYNEHHNHKFQNLQKMYNEWGYIEKDANTVQQNIDRNFVYAHMDQVIEELLARTREHLLDTRRDFQTKIDFYYDSKPVQKIGTAMRGIDKVLRQRFLQLSKEELEQAKFFTEVYGMKKLVADTHEQRQKFVKQIVISYSKIKEELFLDYPKVQAMVMAKEFEYCEIIKQLREKLQNVEAKYKEVAEKQGRADEEIRQLAYENTKNKNELRNKEALLEESQDKLKLITKKFNQQAEQAIQKAKSIMSKAVFQQTNLKNIYRVTPRLARVGDKEMTYPQFADAGRASERLWLKINRFDVGSWILVGLFRPKVAQKNQYEFDNYKDLGHGCYLMDNNKWSYSDHEPEHNCQAIGFQFFTNDTLKLEYFSGEGFLRISKMVAGWEEMRFELNYKEKEEDPLHWCVAMKGTHTEVQIV